MVCTCPAPAEGPRQSRVAERARLLEGVADARPVAAELHRKTATHVAQLRRLGVA